MSLATLGREKWVSQSALSKILQELRDAGGVIPKASSVQSIKRAREGYLQDCETPFGPLLTEVTLQLESRKGRAEKAVQFQFVQPAAFLWWVVRNCQQYSNYFQKMLAEQHVGIDAPLQLCLYGDEISPGNALRHSNSRKVQVLYWSFLAHGLGLLSQERIWFPLGVALSDDVKRLPGKESQFTKEALLQFVQPYDMRYGLKLDFLPEGASKLESRFIFCKVTVLLGDAPALAGMISSKGHTGTKPCPICSNVVDAKSKLHEHDAEGRIVPHTCLDIRKFQKQSDNGVREILRHLQEQRPRLNKTQYGREEQLAGWTLNTHGLLLCDDLALPPISVLMFDWMHVYLVHGLWGEELGMLLGKLKTVCGYSQDDLTVDLQTFTWPQAIGGKSVTGRNAFRKHHEDHIKCGASEGLSLYAVIRYLVQEKAREGLADSLKAEIASYLQLCKVLDMFQSLKRGAARGATTPADLHGAVLQHLRAFQKAYPEASWAPKRHYALHLAEMFHRHQILLACFTHERKHREVKRYAQGSTNIDRNYERGILRDTVYKQLQELHGAPDTPWFGGLCKAGAPSKQMMNLRSVIGEAVLEVAFEAYYAPGSLEVDDVLLLTLDSCYHVGQVLFFASTRCGIWVGVKTWQGLGKNEFLPEGDPLLCPASCIVDVCTYGVRGGKHVVVPNSCWR